MGDDLTYLNSVISSSSSAPSASLNGVSATTSSTSSSSSPPPPPLDMAAIQPILDALRLSNGADADDEQQLDEASIGAMLAKLDQAGVAADGIEARLDSLLGELDGMLEGLEAIQPKGSLDAEQEVTAGHSGSLAEQEQAKQPNQKEPVAQ